METKPFSNSILHKTEDQNNPTSRAPGYSPPHLEERTPRKTLTVVNADGELEEVKLKTHLGTLVYQISVGVRLLIFPTFSTQHALIPYHTFMSVGMFEV